MNHRIGRVDQAVVIVLSETEVRRGEIAAEDPHPRLKILVEPREVQVELQGLP